MAKKFQLERPELAEELAGKQARAERARDHQRLMAVRLAMSGELTLAPIAKAVGKARSTVAEWMRVVRASGLESLLALHHAPRSSKPKRTRNCARGCAADAGDGSRTPSNGWPNATG